MRIIFLNRYFHPDHSATSQMLSDLAFGLAGRGLDVDVGFQPAALRRCSGGAAGRRMHRRGGDPSRRLLALRSRQACWPGPRLPHVLRLSGLALWRIASKGDIVVAKTDPPLVSVVAAPVARLRRARFVNWVQDLFPEVAQASRPQGGRRCSWAMWTARSRD